jgi:sterol desaturase/sphingolipid hydroxylase (fatty acid hydroxylase superfamily)
VLGTYFSQLLGVIAYQAIGTAFVVPLEVLLPRDKMPVRDRARGYLFLLAAAPFAAALSLAVSQWLPDPPIVLRASFGSPIIAAVALALWIDLQFYFLHRIEHRFLWRFHAVHHSVRNLSAINSYHHWTEALWGVIVLTIPLCFVSIQVGPTLGFLTAIFHYWQFYIHAPTKLHTGPFRWLLIDNRYHRIHHSVEARHFNKNFGALSPLWDWLFGTLYMPARDEWPAVGLEIDEPKTLAEWHSLPWRLKDTALLRAEECPAPGDFRPSQRLVDHHAAIPADPSEVAGRAACRHG